MKRTITFMCCVFYASMMLAQNTSLWQPATKKAEKTEGLEYSYAKSSYFLNTDLLKTMLTKAPMREQKSKASDLVIDFPNFEGTIERYRVVEAPVLHASIQKKHPQLRTYLGQSVENPGTWIRFRISPNGFKAIRFSNGSKETYLNAKSGKGISWCTVYKSNSKRAFHTECGVTNEAFHNIVSKNNSNVVTNANDGIRRSYRLAVAATGEYTQQHGGTKALAYEAITDTVLFLNQVFENDFNVFLELVSDEDLVYTDPVNDPYNFLHNYFDEVHSDLNNQLGASAYDIGHLFGGKGFKGSSVGKGTVCDDTSKAMAYSSISNPIEDEFNRLVAHEMGHQFGANHTWTHRGSENTGMQVEPGSGSTIMSYASTADAFVKVENMPDPYFHAVSIEQVMTFITHSTCQNSVSTFNAFPVVYAGPDVTIPMGTPFVLEATAYDPDSNELLTYCWEQMDENNASTMFPDVNSSTGVAFRSFLPSISRKRYFPGMETIKEGFTFNDWEAIPNVSRDLNFRLTVRSEELFGGNNSDDLKVIVNAAAGPFKVISPNTEVTWITGTTETITWDVAGTNTNGINVSEVDIFLSVDGGETYPISVAENIPNTGSYSLQVPDFPSTENRIMVKADGNIFFDVSDKDFTIVRSNSQTSYCASSGNTSDEHISNVRVGDIDNNSGTSSGYQDFTHLSTDLAKGRTHEVRVTCSWSSQTYTEGYSIWIDYNQDMDFDDPGELVGQRVPTTFTPITGLFTIPQSAMSGPTRMRVSMAYNDVPGPCGSINYGEVEDYTINIVDDQDTTPPIIGLNGSNYIEIPAGSTYTELGAVATDDIDGDISSEIVISGDDVNPFSPGTYTIKYNVSDSSGNAATEIRREVIVKPTLESGYCLSNGDNQHEHISKVLFGNIEASSNPSLQGYEDLTSLSSMNINRGMSHTISIKRGPLPVSNDAIGYAVWIDFNNDMDFEDGDEHVLSIQPTTDWPANGTIVIPNWASLGKKRMRVSMSYNSVPTSPCGSVGYGEVKDFTVDIIENIQDTLAPEIMLNGSTVVDLNLGDTYNELGAIAVDDIDGNISSQIVIGGDVVNTSVAGIYIITYNVADSSGNAATEVTRTVIVNMAQTSNYCSATGNTQYEYISNVSLGSINHNSGGSSNGYSDFTSEETTLAKGATYNISIDTNSGYRQFYAVWIDYNQDGDFNDQGEQVFTKENTSNHPVNDAITIPQQSQLGTTRMRVSMRYGALPSACGSLTYGEVEDYTVNITQSASTTTYCELAGNTQYEHISNVSIGSINHSSGGSSNGYSDFTSQQTHLERNLQHAINITVVKGSQTDRLGYKVWIDYNDDGDFSDPAETVWVKQPTSDSQISGSFNVHNSVNPGIKRMRVAMAYNEMPGSPCGSVNYGEVEDYKVNITSTAFRQASSEYEALTLHPNPVKGNQLKVVSKSYDIQSYVLFTAVGQLISEKKQQGIEVIDVSGLEPGIYRIRFVVLDSLKKQKVIVKQFIKQK